MRNSRMKKKVAYVLGTRPDIVRSAHIIQALRNDPEVTLQLIHTGQHYDYAMSKAFFKELGLPVPGVNLRVGAKSQGAQTAQMIEGLEKCFEKWRPDIVAVFGDTNSSLAAALAATKLHIPLAHLEAGPREWDMTLPEEGNRRLIGHCAILLLAVSENSVKNLRRERVLGEVYNTGDPLFNVFRESWKRSKKMGLQKKLGLKKGGYIFLTLHRQGNVDNPVRFRNILDALSACPFRIVFPIHPRTKVRLEELGYPPKKLSNFIITDPLEHAEVLHLVSGARIVVTDSGGLQKEVFWAKVPCITLRDVTAWSETVERGVNFLAGTNTRKIAATITHIESRHEEIRRRFSHAKDPYYRPHTTKKTVELLKKYCAIN